MKTQHHQSILGFFQRFNWLRGESASLTKCFLLSVKWAEVKAVSRLRYCDFLALKRLLRRTEKMRCGYWMLERLTTGCKSSALPLP
jgi:hypothetical protein